MIDEEKIKLPKGQTAHVFEYDTNHILHHIIASDLTNTKWYYYAVDEKGKITKERTGASPLEFR